MSQLITHDLREKKLYIRYVHVGQCFIQVKCATSTSIHHCTVAVFVELGSVKSSDLTSQLAFMT